MNIEQADRILKKINRLFETMAVDDKIDVFEQDLMLSYIRQLKEACSTTKTTEKTPSFTAPDIPKTPEPKPEIKTTSKTVTKKPAPLSTYSKPRKRRSWAFPGTTDPEPATKKPASLPVVKKYAAEVKKAVIPAPNIPAPKPVVKKAPKPVADKPRPSAKKATPPKAKVEKKAAPTPKAKAPGPAHSVPGILKPKKPTDGSSKSDYEELFDFKDAKELLEIRSQMPIKDLTKVMLSREKRSTIKDLFGGDDKAFDATLKTLNTFKSYNQAKAYLSDNIAAKYAWLDKSRKDKASDFIILVRRRYN
jgi:hypothetical protein